MKVILLLFIFVAASSLTLQGLDVSSYDDTIDWPRVARSKHFAIIRAGTGYKGGNYKDENFEINYKNAKAAGVKVGAYWYSYATSADEAKQEAKYFMQHLKGKQFEWPVYYDIEEESQFEAGIHNSIAKAFCNVLEANKFFCGIYSSAYKWSYSFDREVRSRYTAWVAHWDVSRPSYNGEYEVWQKTATGRVDGID